MNELTKAGITTGIVLATLSSLYVVDRKLDYFEKNRYAIRYAGQKIGNKDGKISEQELPEYYKLVTGNSERIPTFSELKRFLETEGLNTLQKK